MIRSFFRSYLDFLFATMVEPFRLPELIQRMGGLRWFSLMSLLLVSISGAVGSYMLRDYFSAYFGFELFLLFLLHLVFLGAWALLFAAIVESLASFLDYAKAGDENRRLFHITVQSFVPFTFFMPAALSTRGLERPEILMIPVVLALTGWSVYIIIMSFVRIFAISVKQGGLLFLSSSVVILSFPALSLLFLLILLGELFL